MKFKIAFLVIAGLGSAMLEARYQNIPLATKALSEALNGTVADLQKALKELRESTPGIQNNSDVKKLVAQIEAKLGGEALIPVTPPGGDKGPEPKPVEPAKVDFLAVEAAATTVKAAKDAVQVAITNAKLDQKEVDSINEKAFGGVKVFVK